MTIKVSIATVMIIVVGTVVLSSTFATTGDYTYGTMSSTSASTTASTPVLTYTAYLPLISSHCLPFPPPSPTPSFFWATCFGSLDEVQNYHLNTQGRYSLIDDHTGSGRGKILKCEAAPDLAYFDPQYTPNGRTVVRSYPTMYFSQKNGPHLVGLDVYVENNFSPAIRSTSDGPLLSLLSDFYDTGHGAGWIIGVTADLKLIGGNYFLVLGNVNNWEAPLLPGTPPFTFGQWHRIEIMVTSQREVQLFQDGQLISVGELRNGIGVATGGGHPGLYGLSGDGQHQAPFATGTLYNDNWSMVVWAP